MDLATTSLPARSFTFGAYRSINLSPSAFIKYPPSPLQPSVTREPAPYMPVGWNCHISMSCAGKPALRAIPRPSPVLINAFVVDAYILPAPPVARTVD